MEIQREDYPEYAKKELEGGPLLRVDDVGPYVAALIERQEEVFRKLRSKPKIDTFQAYQKTRPKDQTTSSRSAHWSVVAMAISVSFLLGLTICRSVDSYQSSQIEATKTVSTPTPKSILDAFWSIVPTPELPYPPKFPKAP